MAADRRVKYTKMVLQESLIKLLQKKSISRITVKELCRNGRHKPCDFLYPLHGSVRPPEKDFG